MQVIDMENEKFHHKGFVLEYKPIHYHGLVENYLLDIYHTNMIKPDDIVNDLGAGIGDFAIRAMRRAKFVIAVEPNKEDFQLLCTAFFEEKCGIPNGSSNIDCYFSSHVRLAIYFA